MPNWKKVIVSGSDATLNSLNVVSGSTISGSFAVLGTAGNTVFSVNTNTLVFSGSLYTSGSISATGSLSVNGGITGSLLGTASYATTASYAMNGGGGGLGALYIQDEGITQGTASYIDFVGAAVTATVTNGTASISVGGGGTAIQGASVQFTMPTASTTWSINHSINSRTPVVEVYDNNYNVIIPTGIYNPAAYQTEIYFQVSQSGYAIISTGGVLSVSGSNAILNQTSASTTWSFNHNLNNLYPVFTIFDSNNDVIIPQRIHVVDTGSALIYFSTSRTGTAVASIAGNQIFASSSLSSSYATSASYANNTTTASYALTATSASYAVTASSAGTFIVRNSLTASGLIYPTADGTYASQVLQTDAAGNLSFGNVETTFDTIYNGEATSLTKGTPVYVSGSQGANPKVYRADASNAAKMPVVYIIAETITAGSTGRGITLGHIEGIDLTGYTEGQSVYVAAGGGWTATRPTGSVTIQFLGLITKAGNGGKGFVANPGPATLPNLQTGYIWVGDSSYYPTAVSTSSLLVSTSSFASTASYVLNAISSSWASYASQSGYSTRTSTISVSGINTDANYVFPLIITGSGASFGLNSGTTVGFTYNPSSSLFKINNLQATGSLLGTSSFANNATSASYANNTTTASYALNATSASFASTAASGTGSFTGSFNGVITGSLLGTASRADNATSASYAANATTASYSLNTTSASYAATATSASFASNAAQAQTASYIATASYANNSISASYSLVATSASYSTNALTASYALVAAAGGFPYTGSALITGSLAVTGAVNSTSGFTGSLQGTASYASNALTASYALVAAAGGFPYTGSALITGSLGVTGSINATLGFTGSLLGTASTASYVTTAQTASYVSQAISASYATFALTASNAPGYTVSFTQSVAATTWSFTHNMNTRYPIVQVYDSNYQQIIPNNIVGTGVNTVDVRFDYAQSGYAVMSNGGGLYVTGSTSLLNQTSAATTWSFTHNLNSKYVNFEVYDSNDFVIIPASIKAIDVNSAELYFATSQTGKAVANFSGINGAPNATTASYALTATSASYAVNTTSASYATTASYLAPVTNGYVVLTQVSQSLNYVDDTAAAAGGVPLGGLYRNGNFIMIRLT